MSGGESGGHELLPWDTEWFGVRIARLNGEMRDTGEVGAAVDWCDANRVQCAYWLAPEGYDASGVEARGFRMVDTRALLVKAAPMGGELFPDVREAREGDLPSLEEIAAASHGASRFYRDGRFAKERCDEMYRLWIRNQVRNGDGKAFVIEADAAAVGYVTCHWEGEGVGQVGLVGIDSKFRRRGLGARLMRHAMGWLEAGGGERVFLYTQGANVEATGFYARLGFECAWARRWYHYWPEEGARRG